MASIETMALDVDGDQFNNAFAIVSLFAIGMANNCDWGRFFGMRVPGSTVM